MEVGCRLTKTWQYQKGFNGCPRLLRLYPPCWFRVTISHHGNDNKIEKTERWPSLFYKSSGNISSTWKCVRLLVNYHACGTSQYFLCVCDRWLFVLRVHVLYVHQSFLENNFNFMESAEGDETSTGQHSLGATWGTRILQSSTTALTI